MTGPTVRQRTVATGLKGHYHAVWTFWRLHRFIPLIFQEQS